MSNSISLVNAGLLKALKVAIVCVIDIEWTGLGESAGKNNCYKRFIPC